MPLNNFNPNSSTSSATTSISVTKRKLFHVVLADDGVKNRFGGRKYYTATELGRDLNIDLPQGVSMLRVVELNNPASDDET